MVHPHRHIPGFNYDHCGLRFTCTRRAAVSVPWVHTVKRWTRDTRTFHSVLPAVAHFTGPTRNSNDITICKHLTIICTSASHIIIVIITDWTAGISLVVLWVGAVNRQTLLGMTRDGASITAAYRTWIVVVRDLSTLFNVLSTIFTI